MDCKKIQRKPELRTSLKGREKIEVRRDGVVKRQMRVVLDLMLNV